MTIHPFGPLVAVTDYESLKTAVRLSGQFAAAARDSITKSGNDARLLNVMTQDEAADAQYIEWRMNDLPRRNAEENATYNFFQLALYDIFTEMAERAHIENLEDHIPKEMANWDMVAFLHKQERSALSLVTMCAIKM